MQFLWTACRFFHRFIIIISLCVVLRHKYLLIIMFYHVRIDIQLFTNHTYCLFHNFHSVCYFNCKLLLSLIINILLLRFLLCKDGLIKQFELAFRVIQIRVRSTSLASSSCEFILQLFYHESYGMNSVIILELFLQLFILLPLGLHMHIYKCGSPDISVGITTQQPEEGWGQTVVLSLTNCAPRPPCA